MRITHTLPVPRPGRNENPGIIPPWMQHPANGGMDTGIVPPWLVRAGATPAPAQARTGARAVEPMPIVLDPDMPHTM